MVKKFNFSKHTDDSEAESHRILNVYVRYMLNKFQIRKYNHYIFETCPRYSFYLWHLNGIVIKAKEYSYQKKSNLICNPTRCKEIDILVKRFIMRKYKIYLIYSNKYIPYEIFHYKRFNYSFSKLLNDLIFDLKEVRSNSYKKEQNFSNNFKSSILILTHEISEKNKPYNNYGDKTSNFFRNSDKKIILIKPNEIGLTSYDKLRNSFYIFKTIISKIIIKRFIKISDLHFIIFQIYNEIYKNKLKKYFIKNKIKKIVSSYITFRYEPIYFEAAKEIKINFYCLDYSLGYPLYNSSYLRYLPDTRKFGDIIFSNSKFRSEMYSKSLSFLDNPPLVRSHICPQADYFVKEKTKLLKNSKIKNIGIVGGNITLHRKNIHSLVKLLSKKDYKLSYLLQSKNDELQAEFKRFDFEEKYISSGVRGDFKKLQKVDLIISIGWQSAALKSAAFFDKPIIFYTHYSYPYKKHNFSFEELKSQKIDQLCNQLWLNNKNFNNNFQRILKSEKEFKIITEKSSYLLSEIGFYKNNLEKYLEIYLK